MNIILRHSMDMFGDEIASKILNRSLHNHFNHFYEPVPVTLFGKKGVFDFNWRMTKDVGMLKGDTLDFNFLGEFTNRAHHYSKLPQPKKLKVEPKEGVLQIAISDRTVNTFLEQAVE